MLDGKRQFLGERKSQGKIRDPQDQRERRALGWKRRGHRKSLKRGSLDEYLTRYCRTLIPGCLKRSRRRATNRSFDCAQDRLEAYLPVRWSEAIERNEAGGPFSIAC
jgi:hypothetical protein